MRPHACDWFPRSIANNETGIRSRLSIRHRFTGLAIDAHGNGSSMKLIATPSQTVGPFFSIWLAHLHQDSTKINSADTQMITGIVVDGDGQPIPDCVLEFWTASFFARVPTSVEGKYSVNVEAETTKCEVLLFMRGLLKPV